MLSADTEGTRREHGLGAVPRADPGAVLGAIRRSDVLVSGGGGLLQDATGPGSVPYYIGVIAAARLLRRPVMVYAQGIGPLRGRLARGGLRMLRSAQVVTVRDAESAHLLAEAGVRGVEVTADAVLSLPRPVPTSGVPPELSALGVGPRDVVVAFAPRPYGGDSFTARLAAAADAVADALRARPVLVPMQGREDGPACARLAAAMRARAAVLGPDVPAARYPALFSRFQAVVGMRLHALILAALCRVPAVGLTFDPKIEAFVRNLPSAQRHLPLDAGPAELASCLASVYPLAPAALDALDGTVDGLQALARRNNDLLLGLVGGAAAVDSAPRRRIS